MHPCHQDQGRNLHHSPVRPGETVIRAADGSEDVFEAPVCVAVSVGVEAMPR